MDEFESTQFELDMLTVSFMYSMPYEKAVEAARKELREMREADKELLAAEKQGNQQAIAQQTNAVRFAHA